MSNVGDPEGQNKLGLFEATKIQVRETMASKFALIPEEVTLPAELKDLPIPEEIQEDVQFRDEVNRVLPGILVQEGRVLVIQDIATQHAVATAPVFLESGLDTYFAFIPEDTSVRPDFMIGPYYQPRRVMSVALANRERIRRAKDRLDRSNLRGIVISIDPHASFEDENGEFDKFLPTEARLKELGISRVVFMGEFAPQSAQAISKRRLERKESWDKSQVYDYMRQVRAKGFPVTFVGIDTRHSND